jgi:hypothetical protein
MGLETDSGGGGGEPGYAPVRRTHPAPNRTFSASDKLKPYTSTSPLGRWVNSCGSSRSHPAPNRTFSNPTQERRQSPNHSQNHNTHHDQRLKATYHTNRQNARRLAGRCAPFRLSFRWLRSVSAPFPLRQSWLRRQSSIVQSDGWHRASEVQAAPCQNAVTLHSNRWTA